MKELVCKICDKQYKTIQSLCNHNKRFHNNIKTTFSELKQPFVELKQPLVEPIQPLVEPIQPLVETTTPFIEPIQSLHFCLKCSKNFKHYNNKWRHEKTCKKINPANEIVNKNISTHTIINKNIINNNTTNNGTINNNITINNYSNDNLEYISDAFIKKMFNHLRYNDEHIKSIPSMIENIKFNPNHKENNNVKITNMRSKVAMVYDNNKWSTIGKKELFDELYLFATNLFKNWSEMKDFITEEMKTNYKSFSRTTQISLTKAFMEEINRKAYIYTKNNDTTLDK